MQGELFAIVVALLWTTCSLFFEYASREIKSLHLNLIRLVPAFVVMAVTLFVIGGEFFPVYANKYVWFWISLSGFSGFVFCDYFLLASYRFIPAKTTQLIMTLNPPVAAIFAFILMGEKLPSEGLLGMILTLLGIIISLYRRGGSSEEVAMPIAANYSIVTKPRRPRFSIKKLKEKYPVKGYVYALLAALGQGMGFVLSKVGMIFHEEEIMRSGVDIPSIYIPLAGTYIRIVIGIFFFGLMIILRKETKDFIASTRKKKHMLAAMGGTLTGPILGVSLSLAAVQNSNTAVATTIMALVPILILLPDSLIHKRRIRTIEVVGAMISVCGVAIMSFA